MLLPCENSRNIVSPLDKKANRGILIFHSAVGYHSLDM
jgi:hypothetical protein